MDNQEIEDQLGARFAKFSIIIEDIFEKNPGKNNFRAGFRKIFNKALKNEAGENTQLMDALMYVSKLLQEIAYSHLRMKSSQKYCHAEVDLMLLIFEIDSDSNFYLPCLIKLRSTYSEDTAALSNVQKALGENLAEVVEISKKVIDEL